jgi:hypothetical protein
MTRGDDEVVYTMLTVMVARRTMLDLESTIIVCKR